MRAPCVRDTGPGVAGVRGWRAFMYFLRADCPMQLGRAPCALELSAPPSMALFGRAAHDGARDHVVSMRTRDRRPNSGGERPLTHRLERGVRRGVSTGRGDALTS